MTWSRAILEGEVSNKQSHEFLNCSNLQEVVDSRYKWHQYSQKVTFHNQNLSTYLVNYPHCHLLPWYSTSLLPIPLFTHHLSSVIFQYRSSCQHFGLFFFLNHSPNCYTYKKWEIKHISTCLLSSMITNIQLKCNKW